MAWTITVGTPSNGSGTSVQPALPAYSQGDLLLAVILNDGGSQSQTIDQSYADISGLDDITDGSCTASVFSKVATASETAPTISFANDYYYAYVVAISGQDTSWEGALSANTGSGSTTTASGITTEGANSLVLAFHGNDRDRGTPSLQTGTWADELAVSAGGSNGLGIALASKEFASASSATGDVTWTISISDGFVCFQLELLSPDPALSDSFTDDLDNWLDDETVGTPDYLPQFSDDLDAWSDKAKFIWPLTLSFTDDLDNWIDSTPALTEVAIEITASEVPLWFKDGFEWDDTKNPDYTFADDLNNWSDSIQIVTGIPVLVFDDLDAWLDGESHNLADAGATPLSEEHASDLDNWNDSIDLLLVYIIETADDLDNWNDSINTFAEYFLTVSDDLDNWSDLVVLFHGLVIADDLDNWLDNIVSFRSPALAFSDNIRAPPFPDPADAYSTLLGLLITEEDALSLSDSNDRILGYSLTLSDDLNNWLDDEDHNLADAGAVDLPITESDDLNNWLDDADPILGKTLSFTDAMSLSDNNARASDFFKTFSDTVTLSDSSVREMLHLISKSDQMTLTEAVAYAQGLGFDFQDTLTLSDANARLMAHLLVPADQMTLSDSISRLYPLADSFADTMSLSDVDLEVLGLSLTTDDSMTLSDSHVKLLQLLMTYIDTMTLSDYVTRKRGVEDGEMPAFTSAKWPNQNYYIGPFKV
jgi:hypothetical protein